MKSKENITLKEFIKFIMPSILVMIFIPVYTMVDGYFISRFVWADALASVNLTTPINSIIFAVGVMFITGGGALISMKLGENDKKTASKYFSMLVTVALIFGVFVSILAFIFKDSILSFLNVTPELYSYANSYITFSFLILPLLILKVQFSGFSRSSGNPKGALYLSVVGGITNIVLDYIFIVILGMGVAGAGLATFLGYLAALLYGSKYFFSKNAVLKFKFTKIDFKVLSQVIFNGSSEMISELAVGFTTLVFNSLMMAYAGKEGVAAITVILYINLLISATFQGFSMGMSPLVSYFYGAKKPEALKNVISYSRKVLLILSITLVSFVFLSRTTLTSLFFNEVNTAYTLATEGLLIFSLAFLFAGYNLFGSSLYTALGNGKISILIAFSKTFIIFALASYSLPILFGTTGIWLIMPITEFLTFFIVLYFANNKRISNFINSN